MEETISVSRIYNELLALKQEVDYIKKNLVDPDTILTKEEEVELENSLKELEEEKTFTLEDIEKERKNV